MTCNISSISLLKWIQLFSPNISSVTQLTHKPTFVLFISTLFNTTIEDNENIESLFNQINLQYPDIFIQQGSFDFSAYFNGDQDQILVLLGFIQTQYQIYYIIYTILKNQDLSFTSYVSFCFNQNVSR
jgi:hypothetical protein